MPHRATTVDFPANARKAMAGANLQKALEKMRSGFIEKRLAATGFAEFQPLDPRQDEIAFRRNRRIELKLTQR